MLVAEEKLTAEEWARRMAKRRAAALSPEERKEIARRAAQKRWKDAKKRKAKG
jgi:hypothetical protein